MKNLAIFLCTSILFNITATAVSANPLFSTDFHPLYPSDTSIMAHYGVGSPLRMNEIKVRAARHFEKQYHSDNEKWYKLDEGFVAVFGDHLNINRAYYDNQGRFQFTVKNYEEKDMPSEVRKMVKERYTGYKICVVTEIITDERTIYQVHIKDEHTVKTIQVWDHQMKLIEDLINEEV